MVLKVKNSNCEKAESREAHGSVKKKERLGPNFNTSEYYYLLKQDTHNQIKI